MKYKATLFLNTLKIKSSRGIYWFIAFFGIFILITGIYLMASDRPYYHLLFSLGLILSSAGLYFFINSKYYKIYINKDPGYISVLESTFASISPLKIPIKHYSAINIRTNIKKVRPGKIKTSHEIILMNEFGSSLFISEFDKKDQALNFAKKLQDLTGRDLIIDNTPVIKNVKLRDISMTKLDIEIPRRSNLNKTEEGNVLTLTWKNKFSFLHFIFSGMILYGLYHLLTYSIVSGMLPGSGKIVLNILLALFVLFLVLYIFIKNIAAYHLNIGKEEINSYLRIFGKWVWFNQLKRSDIVMVENTLNINKPVMEIISRDGYKSLTGLIDTLKNPSGESVQSLKSRLKIIENGTIQLNVSSLSMTEKFYLEEMILKN